MISIWNMKMHSLIRILKSYLWQNIFWPLVLLKHIHCGLRHRLLSAAIRHGTFMKLVLCLRWYFGRISKRHPTKLLLKCWVAFKAPAGREQVQNLWSAWLKSWCNHILLRKQSTAWKSVFEICAANCNWRISVFSSNAHQTMVFEYLSILEFTHFTNKLLFTIAIYVTRTPPISLE